MATGPESAYRPAPVLAHLVTILFVAGAVVSALAALATAMQIALLEAVRDGATLSPGRAEAHDGRQRLFGVAELVIGVAAIVAFLTWVYRANRNARALGAGWMSYSPGWSVGCFFVPLMSLVWPYLAVREIWRASRPGPGGQPLANASPLLGAWWAACVARSVIKYSRFGVLFGDGGLVDLTRHREWEAGRGLSADPIWLRHLTEFSWGLLAHDVVAVAACVLGAAVVVSITDMQERKRAAAGAEEMGEFNV